MNFKTCIFLFIGFLLFTGAKGQVLKTQQGLLFKSGTAIRLGSVQILNKHRGIKTKSNEVGVFNIAALPGDTLQFTSDNYLMDEFIVTDLTDKIMYLRPIIELAEVVIKEKSLMQEIRETQRGYRKKSVFYTGTPHYYYLFLKPMTFIYENFKSEVKDARRFNRFAKREIEANEVRKRFNDTLIKQVVPIRNNEIDDFRTDYAPPSAKLNGMSDYDLINYIKDSYKDYRKKSGGKGLY